MPTLGGPNSAANGINPQSTTIVGQAEAPDGSRHAVSWRLRRAGWELIDAGTVHGQKEGALFLDINRLGTRAGAAQKSSTLFHALTEQSGTVTDLGTGPAETSIASAVTDAGTAVGTKGPLAATTSDPVVWQNGTVDVLDDRGGAGRAEDANNGIVVVGSIRAPDAPVSTAAAWGSGPLVVLQDRIPAGSGWTLVGANAINDRGVIAGTGFYEGRTHAFLLTPTR